MAPPADSNRHHSSKVVELILIKRQDKELHASNTSAEEPSSDKASISHKSPMNVFGGRPLQKDA